MHQFQTINTDFGFRLNNMDHRRRTRSRTGTNDLIAEIGNGALLTGPCCDVDKSSS